MPRLKTIPPAPLSPNTHHRKLCHRRRREGAPGATAEPSAAGTLRGSRQWSIIPPEADQTWDGLENGRRRQPPADHSPSLTVVHDTASLTDEAGARSCTDPQYSRLRSPQPPAGASWCRLRHPTPQQAHPFSSAMPRKRTLCGASLCKGFPDTARD